jgi:4,5-dihydroxyphthalate decarboxylase
VQGELEKTGGHGKPPETPLLGPVRIEDNLSAKSLTQLLDANDISATIGANVPSSLGRNRAIQRLFPDYREREIDYYRRTGIFPIMHVVVIKRSLYQAHPFIAKSLYEAFCAAKNQTMTSLRLKAASFSMLPWARHEAEEMHRLFEGDFWPYGIKPNRRTLEALVTYLVEQHLLAREIPLERLLIPVD